MPSTTIMVTTEAHARLKAWKETGQSFSDVILSVVPPPPAKNAGEVLDRIQALEGKGLMDPSRVKILREGRKRRSPRHGSR